MAKMASTSITFAAADTTPVTFDDSPTTGYPSLNYTLVGEVIEIPEYGPSAQVVESNPLAEGVTEKFKGFINYGSVNIGLEADFEDAGQAILTAAVDGLGKYKRHTFRITYPTGTSEYFSGKVFSFTRNIGSANSMIGASVQLEIETKILRINGDPNEPTAGQVRILSGVGPAPGIEQIYSGSIWRPRGGIQVLSAENLSGITTTQIFNSGGTNPTAIPGWSLTIPAALFSRPGTTLRGMVRAHLEGTIGSGGAPQANIRAGFSGGGGVSYFNLCRTALMSSANPFSQGLGIMTRISSTSIEFMAQAGNLVWSGSQPADGLATGLATGDFTLGLYGGISTTPGAGELLRFTSVLVELIG